MLLFYGICNCQVSDYGSSTKTLSVRSEENIEYKLKVTLPDGFNLNKSYKSLYYIDAWWLSEIVIGTYAILNLSDKVDDIVLIGVSIDGKLTDWNSRRTLDLTPSKYDLQKMGFEFTIGTGENSLTITDKNSGNADIFLQLLERKIIPLINIEYPNLKDKRGILGHSLGGLFGIHALQKKPEIFSDYIIISPSVWWIKEELIKNKLFNKIENSDAFETVYLANGQLESKLILKSNIELNTILDGLKSNNFAYKFKSYEDQDHNSVLSRAIYDSIKFIYGK